MGSPIGIHFQAENEEVLDASGEIQESLGTIDEALAEVEDSGKDLATELIKNFTETARQAGKSADEIERTLVESYDVPADAAQRMARIATSGLDDVKDSAEEVKDETGRVADRVSGQLTSAFETWDGTAQGAVRSVGSGLAGLAGIIPGIGGLIGAGLGVVVSQWADSWGDAAQEVEDRVSSMYEDMVESGNKALSQQFVQQGLKELFDDQGKLAEVKKAADELGLSVATVAEAWVGVPAAMDVVGQKADELADKALLNGNPDDGALIAYYRSVQDTLDGVKGSTDDAATAAAYYEASVAQNAKRWEESGAAVDAAGQKVDDLRNNVAGGVPVALTVDGSPIDRELAKSRTVRVNLEGVLRNGQRVV